MSEQAVKHDAGKPDYTLLDKQFLEGLISVMQHGEKKYGRDTWRQGIGEQRLLSAAARHLFAIINGEDIDQDSGLAHIYHVAANMQMMTASMAEATHDN